MKAVIQRVKKSSVTVDGNITGEIDNGLLILLGVASDDTEADADYLAAKIPELRIFEDENSKMNLSLIETGGAALVVSQFTLLANCEKGRRPSYKDAAAPEKANHLYEYFISLLRKRKIKTETGQFRAMMSVDLTNDGPVTLIVKSKKK